MPKKKAAAKKAANLPRATFCKGDDLTAAQVQEFLRLKGKDGKGQFKFADEE